MSFDPQRDEWSHGCGEWFQPINPKEHIYTAGYGFSPKPPFVIEKNLIGRCSTTVVLCLLAFMFLNSFLPQFFEQFIFTLLPRARFSPLEEPLHQLVLMLSSVCSLTLPFALYAAHTRIPLKSAVPVRHVPAGVVLSALLVALAASVVGMYASDAVYFVFSSVGVYFYEPMIVLPSGIVSILLYILNLTVIPALFEEMAFRGVIMQSLRRFGDSFALIISAILFALVHISPLSVPMAFIMGLVIGYFVLFSGSVHTGIVIHLTYNALSLAVSQIGRLDHDIGRLLFLAINLLYLAMGAFAVVWLIRRYENMFALKNSSTINRSHVKLRCFMLTLPFFILMMTVIAQAGAYLL